MVKRGRSSASRKHLNDAEAELMAMVPGITRISTHANPRFVTITITKNHNPDFKVFYPEQGRGIIIELKGHIQDKYYLPMLKEFPPALKKIYKVVLVERNMRERAKVKKRLDEYGIEWYDDTVDPRWLVQASELYTGIQVLTDEEKEELAACLNYFQNKTDSLKTLDL